MYGRSEHRDYYTYLLSFHLYVEWMVLLFRGFLRFSDFFEFWDFLIFFGILGFSDFLVFWDFLFSLFDESSHNLLLTDFALLSRII